MLGLNDAYHLGWAREEYERDYLKMVQEILRLHSNATIFVAVPPQGAYAFHHDKVRGGDGALKLTRRSLAHAVEKVRSEAHLETPAINFFDAFAWAAGLKPNVVVKHPGPSISADELYLEDGVHPSAVGYGAMAAAAAAAISKDAMSPRSFCLRCESSAHPDLCKAFCNKTGEAAS
ncbi:unnamed protein product [Prorocentrum cordatum]|uniref:SGNH hydrolase-type esterase domain-containing protein n=1 Tax=Prorocentrum cordatum TaxID=2364126 RepID=A0ABN9RVH3_9DINO|nr:unnamed protein product [Polarella glacialis]